MHMHTSAGGYILQFLKILFLSINVAGHRLRIAHFVCKDMVKLLKMLEEFQVISNLGRADGVLADISFLENFLTSFIKETSDHTLLAILDIIANINQRPEEETAFKKN